MKTDFSTDITSESLQQIFDLSLGQTSSSAMISPLKDTLSALIGGNKPIYLVIEPAMSR